MTDTLQLLTEHAPELAAAITGMTSAVNKEGEGLTLFSFAILFALVLWFLNKLHFFEYLHYLEQKRVRR